LAIAKCNANKSQNVKCDANNLKKMHDFYEAILRFRRYFSGSNVIATKIANNCKSLRNIGENCKCER
jgi:hypothetical protein